MIKKSKITYCFALLITSLFVVASCDSGEPNPAPNMPLQESEGNADEGVDQDGELPELSFEIEAPSTNTVFEGDNFSLIIRNTSELEEDIEVNVNFGGSGTYGQDFTVTGDYKDITAEGAVLTISKESREAFISVTTIRDGISEGAESVSVAVTGASTESGLEYSVPSEDAEELTATMTIINVFNIVTLSSQQIDNSIGDTRTVNIPVQLAGSALQETTIAYDVSVQGQIGGNLFTDVTGGSVKIGTGQSSANIQIRIEDGAYNKCINPVVIVVSLNNQSITAGADDIFVDGGANQTLINVESSLDGCIPISNYCSASGTTTQDEWIQRFVLGSIDNNSGNNGGYADFTNFSTNLQRGSTVSMFAQPGYSGIFYFEVFHLWIDFDQSGSFENSERVAIFGANQPILYTTTISIPANAALGSTKMRLSMPYNGVVGPCDSFFYGEIEDYTVFITDNATPGVEDPIIQVPTIEGKDPVEEVDVKFLKNDDPSKVDVEVIGIDTSKDVEVLNSLGDIVKSFTVDGEVFTLDKSDLSNGDYTLKAYLPSKYVTVDFVVK